MEEQFHSHYVFIGAKQLSPVPEKYRSLLVPGQDCRVDGQVALNQGWQLHLGQTLLQIFL